MKKYLILNLLAVVVAFSLSTCNNCEEEFPINGIADLPNPFQVDTVVFETDNGFGEGWRLTFSDPVDASSIVGKVNLRTSSNGTVVYNGYFNVLDPFTLFVSRCEIDAASPPQQSFTYGLELSGDGDQPIRSIYGQSLDGDGDATDGGVYFSSLANHGNCGGNYEPTVSSPPNGSSSSLMVLPNARIEMFIGFNDVRMDTSSFVLGQNVFVTDANTGNPVPVKLFWGENWYSFLIVTDQTQAQFCTGNSCRINVEFQKGPQSAFGMPLSDSNYFTTFVIF